MEQGELINAFSLPLLVFLPGESAGALFYRVGVFADLSACCDQPVRGSRGNQGAIARGGPWHRALYCRISVLFSPTHHFPSDQPFPSRYDEVNIGSYSDRIPPLILPAPPCSVMDTTRDSQGKPTNNQETFREMHRKIFLTHRRVWGRLAILRIWGSLIS